MFAPGFTHVRCRKPTNAPTNCVGLRSLPVVLGDFLLVWLGCHRDSNSHSLMALGSSCRTTRGGVVRAESLEKHDPLARIRYSFDRPGDTFMANAAARSNKTGLQWSNQAGEVISKVTMWNDAIGDERDTQERQTEHIASQAGERHNASNPCLDIRAALVR